MMDLDAQVDTDSGEVDIDRVAKLSKLSFTAQEKVKLSGDLHNILELVEELSDAPVKDLSPMAHPLDMSQPLRVDCVSEPDIHDRVVALAPEMESGLYLVPKVVE